VQNSLKTLTLSLGSALLTAFPSVAANPIIAVLSWMEYSKGKFKTRQAIAENESLLT
jgi:hypothetical protein